MENDLISRSALKEALKRQAKIYENEIDIRCNAYFGLGVAAIELRKSPAIDAVPVVRCVDCKYRCTIVCPMFHTEYSWDADDGCDWYDVDRTDDDGFCHLGERWECEEDD